MGAILVGHGQAEWRTPHRANKFSMKWPAMGLSQLPRCLTQLADRSAQFMGRRRGRERSSKRDCDGVGQLFRQFPQKASTIEAEDAAPDTIEVNGNDRNRSPLNDPFNPTPERQECSGSGDLAFWKNADEVAVVEGRTCFPECFENDAQSTM